MEGSEDKAALQSLLVVLSSKLKRAIEGGSLAIDPVGGAGNLAYKLHTLEASLCPWHVFFDNDHAGNNAVQKAKDDGILKDADVTQTVCVGMREAEFEDCIEREIYKDAFMAEFNVDVGVADFRGREKWSTRAKKCFEHHGLSWTPKIESKAKTVVARAVATKADAALDSHKGTSIRALIAKLEARLGA